MRVRVQVAIEPDDGGPAAVHEVAELERGALQIDTLGLQLTEAKELLRQVREVVIDEQVRSCLAQQVRVRTAAGRGATKMSTASSCARSGRFLWAARAGGTATAGRNRAGPSAHWRPPYLSEPRRNCVTWRPSSPAWPP